MNVNIIKNGSFSLSWTRIAGSVLGVCVLGCFVLPLYKKGGFVLGVVSGGCYVQTPF